MSAALPPSPRTSGQAPLERLEAGVAALVRWSESRHIRAEIAERSGCELPPSELRLLEFFDLAEPLRISDIAECLRIDISTASLQLRQLRENRLVEATPVKGDRRVSLIAITSKGRETVRKVRTARHALLREVFAGVPDDRLDLTADVLLLVHDHMLAGMRELFGTGATGGTASR
ncbi:MULTISPECIES: MarR family winged helix-turn-helix transcriptional regulator [Pseudofrankia]|uniref:MarR family winged helix-turn-helix transcriptional regulator n=1 Tax=Pseudofrankia TaxID=2994363 RepID=UPI000234D2F7|nr:MULTISPECIES: MarR family transcriptional regulator [Pseudofrankia]OHV33904.1 MarR family transcriptional regulator [Pseudofrankia sp. EUN1h]